MSHNVKAIYQRYMGWYDGNPAHLWQHPPVEAATRYVEFMGGAEGVLTKARESYASGDLRWVAEVVSHVVFAEPDNADARALLADTLEQLGFGSENGTWRNAYLSGATELRSGNFGTPTVTASPDMVAQLTPEMLFDALAVRVDGPRAWDLLLTVDVAFTDGDARFRLRLDNGVLTYSAAAQADQADLVLTIPRRSLALLASGADAATLAGAGATLSGDEGVLARLYAVLDVGDPAFAIVTAD